MKPKDWTETGGSALASYAEAWLMNRGRVMVTTLDRETMRAIAQGWLGSRQRSLVPVADLAELTAEAIRRNSDGDGLGLFQSVRGVEGGYATKCAAQFCLLDL